MSHYMLRYMSPTQQPLYVPLNSRNMSHPVTCTRSNLYPRLVCLHVIFSRVQCHVNQVNLQQLPAACHVYHKLCLHARCIAYLSQVISIRTVHSLFINLHTVYSLLIQWMSTVLFNCSCHASKHLTQCGKATTGPPEHSPR